MVHACKTVDDVDNTIVSIMLLTQYTYWLMLSIFTFIFAVKFLEEQTCEPTILCRGVWNTLHIHFIVLKNNKVQWNLNIFGKWRQGNTDIILYEFKSVRLTNPICFFCFVFYLGGWSLSAIKTKSSQFQKNQNNYVYPIERGEWEDCDGTLVNIF